MRVRHVFPPSLVSKTPAVETPTRSRPGSRGSVTIEWMPGENSPSAAGVPDHFVFPVPGPAKRSPPRDSWSHRPLFSSKVSPPSPLTKRPPGIVPTYTRPSGPNAMVQSFRSVAGFSACAPSPGPVSEGGGGR